MLHHRLRARLILDFAEWILKVGTWDDTNRWLDDQTWNDL